MTTTPTPRPESIPRLTGATSREAPEHLVIGPLVKQPEPAARVARILFAASCDLQDVCTLEDAAQMWEEARAVASRILAACPLD